MKIKRLVAPVLAGTMAMAALVAPVAVNAAEVATGSNAVEVYATQSSSFTVTIPKTIVLDGKEGKGAYSVNVKGNIAGTDVITVTPDANFLMKQAGKADINTAVTQTATSFSYATGVVEGENEGQTETGLIQMEAISAGKWAGQFNFTITSSVDVTAKDSVGSVEADITADEKTGVDSYQEKESVYGELENVVAPVDAGDGE